MNAPILEAGAPGCGVCGRQLAPREAAGRRFGRCPTCAERGVVAQIGRTVRESASFAEPPGAAQLWRLGLRDRDAVRTWAAARGIFVHSTARVGFLRSAPYAGTDAEAPAITAQLVRGSWPAQPLGTLLRYVAPGSFDDLGRAPAPPADLVAEWAHDEAGGDFDEALIDFGPAWPDGGATAVVVGCGLLETLAASSVLGLPPVGFYGRRGLRECHARLLDAFSFRGIREAVLALPDSTSGRVRDALARALARQGVTIRFEAAGWPSWAACALWRQQLRWDRQHG